MDTSPDTVKPGSAQGKGLGRERDLWSLSLHWESALDSDLACDSIAPHSQKFCHLHTGEDAGGGPSHFTALCFTGSLPPWSTQEAPLSWLWLKPKPIPC